MFRFNNKSIRIIGRIKASILRSYQNEVLQGLVCELPKVESVLNLGAMPEDADKEGRLYKDYFDNRQYYTLDKNRMSDSPFHFNMDLNNVASIYARFDLFLAMSVLEHVEDPFKVSSNIQTLLKPGGFIFIATPFFYPIHKDTYGRFSDYWRFTDDGLRALFKGMNEVWIKEAPSIICSVRDRAQYWDDPSNTVSGYCALFQKKGSYNEK